MAQAKQAAKRKRRKIALPVMGAAGVSLALAGGASAISKAWASDNLSGDNAPPREITFGEEEIADVSLATFYVFDKESTAAAKDGNVQLARGCGCRGCGGRGCGGCRGCRGCRCGVGGCGCGVGIGGCCASWGACRWC